MKKAIYVLLAVLTVAVIVLGAAVVHLYRQEPADSAAAGLEPGPAAAPSSASSSAGAESETDVTALSCTVRRGALTLSVGDEFSVSGGSCETSTEGGVMTITADTGEDAPVLVTVPRDTLLDSVTLTAAGGAVAAQDIHVQTLSLSCAQGTIQYAGRVDGDIQVDQAQGETTLQLAGAPGDFNYELDYALGHIGIGGDSYAGAGGKESIDNGAGKTARIQCRMGSVDLLFPEEG